MVGWHHRLNGHEFEQSQGDSEGQEAWCAAVHGVTKSQTQLSEQQQQYLVLNYISTNSDVVFSLSVSEFCEAFFWVWLLFRL